VLFAAVTPNQKKKMLILYVASGAFILGVLFFLGTNLTTGKNKRF